MSKLIVLVLKIYKRFVSPIISGLFGKACRFTPTYSSYTIEALSRFGAIKGSRLGFLRLMKCHPFGGQGLDLVPKR